MHDPAHHSQLQQWLRFSIWFFALGCLFWFVSLSSFNLGIDQEHAILRTDERIWIGQGRWAIFFLNQYIYTQPIISYFPHLVFIALTAISYAFVLDALSVSLEKKWLALITSVLFMSHPMWFFIAEFYTNIIPIAFGFLSCSIAVWLFVQQTKTKNNLLINLAYAGLQTGLIFFALGSYQAFALVISCMFIILLITKYLNKSITLKILWLQGLLSFSYVLIALAAHQLLLQFLYRKFATPPDYIANFININTLLADPRLVLESIVFGWGYYLYLGEPIIYATNLTYIGTSITIGVAVLLYRAIRLRRIGMSLLLVATLLITPLLLQIVAAGFWNIPLRVTIALPLVVWFLAAYPLFIAKNKWIKIALISILLIANVQILYSHALYSSTKQLTAEYDQRTASLLFERILDVVPDYSFENTYPISVYGTLPYHTPYKTIPTTVVDGSFFYWDYGNGHRITKLMQILNYRGLVPVTGKNNETIYDLYPNMPVWPAKDSVQFHKGIILIKLSELPTP